jgi:HSP20 family protein
LPRFFKAGHKRRDKDMFNKFKPINKDGSSPTIEPIANIYEQDNDFVLAVEMPGVDKSSMDVHIHGDTLRIKAEKKQDDVGKEYQALYRERQAVKFEREFTLNANIDKENLKAEYENGILKVFLSKAKELKPKKIDIKT